MTRARVRFAALALLVPLGACTPALPDSPNVLLVTVDTLRPDRLSAYGYRGHGTPHIDRLAAGGALFENAVADAPWTTPSMASVMTGRYPTLHGFKSNNVHRLDPEHVTLAEQLADAGWATAAVVGSFPLDSVYQLDQGFSHYDDDFTTPVWVMPDHAFERLGSGFFESPESQRLFLLSKVLNDSRRLDAEVTDAALAWLDEAGSEPFFLWVHYFGPHEKPDWTVPESARQRRHVGMYDPGVVEVDREVGRLLDALDGAGRAERTLVIFHADHGESLGEQGHLGHGPLLNDASVRVPMLLRLPGAIEAGVRVERLVRNVDIFPTVLDAAGLAPPGPLSGESLLPWIAASPRRRFAGLFEDTPIAYMETYDPAHSGRAHKVKLPDGRESLVGFIRRGVRTPEWKFVRTEPYPVLDVSRGSLPEVPEDVRQRVAREQLFRVDAPGGENDDVIDENPDVAATLRRALDEHLAEERYEEPIETMHVDEEMKLRLEALGYGE